MKYCGLILLFYMCACNANICRVGESEKSLIFELSHFIDSDNFHFDNMYPEAKSMDTVLYSRTLNAYDSNEHVRNLIAGYFIEYDNVLVQKHLLSVSVDSNTLLAILWEKESARNSMFKETPSASMMRTHLLSHTDWFNLTQSQIRRIQLQDKYMRSFINNN